LALQLYLDDCAYSHNLAACLREAGHTVVTPADAEISGADDDRHFEYAVLHELIVVTQNPADFEALHKNHPNHPGVIAICLDNDIERDMSDAEIVEALHRLEETYASAGTPLGGGFHILNAWRGLSQQPSGGRKKRRGKK
jgi:predicted nuclease of predicted toxin-antitoxin system